MADKLVSKLTQQSLEFLLHRGIGGFRVAKLFNDANAEDRLLRRVLHSEHGRDTRCRLHINHLPARALRDVRGTVKNFIFPFRRASGRGEAKQQAGDVGAHGE